MSAALKLCFFVAMAGALDASAQTAIAAQTSPAAAAKKITWAELDKWPDFTTGTWGDVFGAPPANEILKAPLTPNYAAKVAAVLKLSGPGGSGAASCEPEGVVRDTGSKFFFAKDVIVIGGATNRSNVWRRIYMQRTEHGDPEPTYFGDSIGHWEGQTLVIDTAAIRAEAQLITGVPLGSTSTHMIERYRLIDRDTLEVQKTVENPEIFTRPWVTTRTVKRMLGEEFPESICWRDRETHSGTQAPNLTR